MKYSQCHMLYDLFVEVRKRGVCVCGPGIHSSGFMRIQLECQTERACSSPREVGWGAIKTE